MKSDPVLARYDTMVRFLMLLPIAVSCVDTYDVDLPDHGEVPVLSSIMIANQPVRVFHGVSRSLTDSTDNFIEGAEIALRNEQSGEEVILSEEGQGWYISSVVALPQISYTLETWYKNKRVWARDQIPKKGVVTNWDYHFISTGDQHGDDFHNISMLLQDDATNSDYYEFSFISQSCLRTQPNKCFIDYYLFGENVDPKIEAEGILEFDPPYYVLSDVLFTTPQTSVFFQLRNGQTRGGNGIARVEGLTDGNWLNINYGSEAYYRFKKSLLQYRYSINTDEQLEDFQRFFFGTEPQTLFSNVNNGIGVVAGVNKEYIEVF